MKKLNIVLFVSVLTLLLVAGYVYFNFKGRNEFPTNAIALGGGVFATTSANLIGTETVPIYVATTTATTTSATFYVGPEIDQMDLNMELKASSTTSKVQWQYEFSYNGTNWFGEDTKSVSGSTVTHQAATTTHEWTPGMTEKISRNIGIKDLATRYFRLKIYKGLDSAAAANNFTIWVKGAVIDIQ
jgi:hypothetical protein